MREGPEIALTFPFFNLPCGAMGNEQSFSLSISPATAPHEEREMPGYFSHLNKVLDMWTKTFFFFRAAPATHGRSQATGQIGAVAARLQQHGLQAMSVTYTTVHGNARYLSH